jgi:hypothetical protein
MKSLQPAPVLNLVVIRRMKHCLADHNFAGVRGAEALAKVPESERPAWQQLGSDIEALLAGAGGNKSRPEKSAKHQ